MTLLTLLGTGGGRFVTILQERATGGLYLMDGISVHIDPGPGALLQMRRAKLDPMRTDAILVSHCHPDHYTDAEILIEAMTNGTHTKRGHLAASRSIIEGAGEFGPAISKYHQSFVENMTVLSSGDLLELGRLPVHATPSAHSDPSAVGFRIETSDGEVGYISDTALTDEVVEANEGVRVLVVPLTRPLGARIEHHLCTEDAAELIARTSPELAVLNHMGLKILREDPEVQADWISKKSGVRTIVGEDLMRIKMSDRLTVRSPSAVRGGRYQGRRGGTRPGVHRGHHRDAPGREGGDREG